MNTNGPQNGPVTGQTNPNARKPSPRPAPGASISAGASPERSFLAHVKTGKLEQPLRVVVYGPQGVGKSTFAAEAPSPIFIGAEDGTAALDIARFPSPESFEDALAMVRELARTPTQFRTVVIDSLDWMEPLIWQHVCAAENKPSIRKIEDFGYGKGYVAALDEWRRLLIELDHLRAARRMHVVLIAHTAQKKTKNPAGDDWDRFAMKLHDKAAGLVSEWADDVLFAQFEFYTQRTRESRDGKDYSAKAVSTGQRLLYTTWDAAYDAKNRHGLPESIALSWPAFYELATAQTNEERSTVLAEIDALLPRVPAEIAAKASAERESPLQRLRAVATHLRKIADQASASGTDAPAA